MLFTPDKTIRQDSRYKQELGSEIRGDEIWGGRKIGTQEFSIRRIERESRSIAIFRSILLVTFGIGVAFFILYHYGTYRLHCPKLLMSTNAVVISL